MIKINVGIEGIEKVLRKMTAENAEKEFGAEIERAARTMANKASHNAPRDTGRLRNSITASVRREGPVSWSFGSDLPYATRQEYEHATSKAFIRNAVWDEEEAFYTNLARIAGRIGK